MKKATVLASMMTFALSACVLDDPVVGSGPIELSRGVQRGYDQYLAERSPGHFAVSKDGRAYAYNYCSEGRCRQSTKTRSIYRCEQRSEGVPCKIYGAHGKVVWRTEEDVES